MSHRCGTTCKRKTGTPCSTCRVNGGGRSADIVSGTDDEPRKRATPRMIGAAVDMYYDGHSYRQTAANFEDYFGRPTTTMTIYNWNRDLTESASDVLSDTEIPTRDEWVADELAVNVGGKQYWLFNVMDSDSRVVLSAYLSPTRGTRAAATALSMARNRAENPPKRIKTDGLRSYQQGVKTAFPIHQVDHVVSQGIRTEINNNLSERLQGTFRDCDKALRALKKQDSGQAYIDGLVIQYNYFRPHQALNGKTPDESTGADIPLESWREVAEAKRNKEN